MKTSHRILSLVLTAVMLFGILPVISLPADAASAGEYLEVWLGAGRIGNASHGPTNLLDNLQTAKDSGLISISTSNGYEFSGNQYRINVRDSGENTITINFDSPVLQALSLSSTAEYEIWAKAVASCRDYHTSKVHYDRDGMKVTIYKNGSYMDSADSGTKNRDGEWAGHGWRSFYGISSLSFVCKTYRNHDCGYSTVDPDGADDYARIEVELRIRDKTKPVIDGYYGSTGATVNASNNKQLLAKLGVNKNAGGNPENYYYDFSQYNSAGTAAANSREWIDQSFSFSKHVTAGSFGGNSGSVQQIGSGEYNAFASHTLFTNTVGTGFVNAGQPCNLALQDSIGTVSGSFISSLRYRYTVRYGDFSGNNPIPAGGGIITSAGYSYGASLLSKILAAGFHDAAGNPVRDVSLSSGATNIFDRNLGGYDVIVDAVPPTYSRVGNGIYPDILTDVILNKNDTVDFIVSFSEAVIAKKGWSDSNTYLLLDNGGRANFVSKSSDGKRWTFRYTIPDGKAAEATLLKVIAVLNTAQGTPNGGNGAVSSGSDYAAYSYNYDGRAITDFVGNMMVERANADPTKNTKQINSYVGWAGLAVDNTPPTVAFRYMPYGSGMLTHPADANKWGQAVTLYTSATDPDVPVAKYDPSYSSSNTSRPSKGIYRPDNTTGNAGSAVGLIFYTWTRSAAAPNTGANFEAIKRFSLTGIQPRTVTSMSYASAWNGCVLNMANNYQNILPPDEAMTSAGDGAWYLHVWTADMSWDSARQLMQYELAKAQQFKSNGGKLYTAADVVQIKNEQTEAYKKANGGTYDSAWKAVRANVYQQVYTTQFLCWLAKIDYSASNRDSLLQTALGQDAMYTDASMAYARSQATMTQAQYDNTNVWSLDKFANDDSNWSLATARVLLDNTAPTAASFGNITGNNTVAATMVATIADAGSGLDISSIKYQWVAKDAEIGIDWQTVTGASFTEISGGLSGAAYGKATATFTAVTEGQVFDSGEYILYVLCADAAGNEVLLNSGATTVKVNMNNRIGCDFAPEGANTTYRKDVVPAITVEGMLIQKVEYAVSTTADRPTEGFTELTAVSADADLMEYSYVLPMLPDTDGVWYVHVLATGDTGDAQYFRGVYLIDHTEPDVHVNSLGIAEDEISVSVQVTVHDELAGAAETAYYQILTSATSPAADSEDWAALPANGKILITGDPGYYYVHVKATDLAGNETIFVSSPFELVDPDPEPMVLPPYGCQLVTVENGCGIANLLLESADKDGYRYSISTDGGQKWCNWLPYMSMIRINLPEEYTETGKLQVKFRAPDGTVGEPKDIVTDQLVEDAVYMTAEFESTFKRQSGNSLTLIMALPDGVEYTLEGEDNWQTGNFDVIKNGAYSFEMRRGITSATTEFTVVVDIFDDAAPSARLTYSETAPTASNVLVTVHASEPVVVRSVTVQPLGKPVVEAAPKMQYAFTENGSAVFTISDEAGNITTLTASVANIRKTPPAVKITENYDKYIVNGDVASGVTLIVEKENEEASNFVVIGEDPSTIKEVTENGNYTFLVRDSVGNVAAVSKAVTNIVTALPAYTLTSTYAQSGKPVDTSAPQKEDVTVRATFEQITDGRKLYYGTAPAADGSNELAMDGDNYYVERTYMQSGNTLMVVSDDLGNTLRIPVAVEGIDKKAPTLKLQVAQAVITPNDKKLSALSAGELIELFGGYTVSDNFYAPEDIRVSVARSDDIIMAPDKKGDISTPGAYTLIYTATDPAGNSVRAEQSLVVIPGDGLLVQLSGAVLSSAMSNTAIVPSNKVTFSIDAARMQAMFYGTARQKVYNRAMRYDIYYVSGLFREGQLKTIAQKLTAEELVSQNYSVTFPKAGWYTIIIRNQERAREYTTFFVSSYED